MDHSFIVGPMTMFAWQVKTKLQALLGQREEKKNPYCENSVTSTQIHTANII